MNRIGKQQRWVQWGIIFGCWTLYGLFFTSQRYIRDAYLGRPITWRLTLGEWLSEAYAWALLTPPLLILAERFSFERGHRRQSFLIHLSASVFFTLIELLLYLSAAPLVAGSQMWKKDFPSTFLQVFTGEFHHNLFIYWTLLCIILSINYYGKFRERELKAAQLEIKSSQLQAQLAQAQLSALKMQLHPHFLFNTLNAIVVLVRKGSNDEADRMLTGLSELLRCALDNIGAHEVSLKQELEFLDLYLAIEQVRFHDRLKIVRSVEPKTLDAIVPNLVLQPLVENAIRHGVGKHASAGLIVISANRKGKQLHIRIRDNGPGLPKNWRRSNGNGIGITNTQARLQQLYGNAAKLELEGAVDGGTVASLVIPFHLLNEQD